VFLQKTIRRRANRTSSSTTKEFGFSKVKMITLLNSLYDFVKGLRYDEKQVWDDYYGATILGKGYLQEKENVFKSFIEGLPINTAADFGTNDGHFANILAGKAKMVLAIDSGSNCINQLYLAQKANMQANILPLVVDIANPTPAIGFRNQERDSFLSRLTADLVVALALIHHLHFSNNIPLDKQADFFSGLSQKFLLIEFIPVEDEKIKIIAKRKNGDGHRYDARYFEDVFSRKFIIHRTHTLKNGRSLYLMENKANLRQVASSQL
jgi:hypothetical protein